MNSCAPATTRELAPDVDAAVADPSSDPPEQLRITAVALRTLRRRGWTVAEQRKGGWLYLIARGSGQSAVYKLVGPQFDQTGSHYEGYRIA
jgi:hypothetical protein